MYLPNTFASRSVLSRVKLVWIQSFSFSLSKESNRLFYLPIVSGTRDRYMLFLYSINAITVSISKRDDSYSNDASLYVNVIKNLFKLYLPNKSI